MNNRAVLASVALVVVIAAVSLWISHVTSQPAPKPVQESSSTKHHARMWLRTLENRTIFEPGEEIQVYLYMDSDGQRIVGYDGALQPVKGVALTKITPINTNFELQKSGDLQVTGMLHLEQGSEGVILNEEPVAELNLTATEKGPIPLAFNFTKGETRDSNILMASPPDDILDSARGITVYLGEKKRLTRGKALSLGDRTLTLERIELPGDRCADCLTKAVVKVSQGNESQHVTFTLGGITGGRSPMEKVFGINVEIYDISDSYVDMLVAPVQ